jgi:hypothetical protein
MDRTQLETIDTKACCGGCQSTFHGSPEDALAMFNNHMCHIPTDRVDQDITHLPADTVLVTTEKPKTSQESSEGLVVNQSKKGSSESGVSGWSATTESDSKPSAALAKRRRVFNDSWDCQMCRNAGSLCKLHEGMQKDGKKPPSLARF